MNIARSAARVLPSAPHLIYSDNHIAFQNSINKVIQREINPHVDEWEAAGRFPAHHVFRILGRLGIFGVNKPVVAEVLGAISCGGIPMALSVQSDMATPALAQWGSDALKEQFLLPALDGSAVSCIAISEPESGSDVAGIKTTARRNHGGDWVIRGTKMWITNGMQADWACVLANTRPGPSHTNKSLFCVRLDSPGIHRNAPFRKLGMHCSDTAQIVFDDVIVPSGNLIGEEGQGFLYQMMQFQDERLTTAAVLLEPLQAAIKLTIEYTKDRKIFQKPIYDHQVVSFRLAELQSELEAVRSLLYRAVHDKVHGQDVTLLASMAKLKAGRLAREVTDGCLQYFGGQGFMWDNLVSRMYRDLRLHSIGAGADEVMLSIISRHMSREQGSRHS